MSGASFLARLHPGVADVSLCGVDVLEVADDVLGEWSRLVGTGLEVGAGGVDGFGGRVTCGGGASSLPWPAAVQFVGTPTVVRLRDAEGVLGGLVSVQCWPGLAASVPDGDMGGSQSLFGGGEPVACSDGVCEGGCLRHVNQRLALPGRWPPGVVKVLRRERGAGVGRPQGCRRGRW